MIEDKYITYNLKIAAVETSICLYMDTSLFLFKTEIIIAHKMQYANIEYMMSINQYRKMWLSTKQISKSHFKLKYDN